WSSDVCSSDLDEVPAQVVDDSVRSLIVQVRRRFVEDDDIGTGQQRPRHGQALPLTARDLRTVVADPPVEPFGIGPFVETRRTQSGEHVFVARDRLPGKSEIPADGGAEDVRLLRAPG